MGLFGPGEMQKPFEDATTTAPRRVLGFLFCTGSLSFHIPSLPSPRRPRGVVPNASQGYFEISIAFPLLVQQGMESTPPPPHTQAPLSPRGARGAVRPEGRGDEWHRRHRLRRPPRTGLSSSSFLIALAGRGRPPPLPPGPGGGPIPGRSRSRLPPPSLLTTFTGRRQPPPSPSQGEVPTLRPSPPRHSSRSFKH